MNFEQNVMSCQSNSLGNEFLIRFINEHCTELTIRFSTAAVRAVQAVDWTMHGEKGQNDGKILLLWETIATFEWHRKRTNTRRKQKSEISKTIETFMSYCFIWMANMFRSCKFFSLFRLPSVKKLHFNVFIDLILSPSCTYSICMYTCASVWSDHIFKLLCAKEVKDAKN